MNTIDSYFKKDVQYRYRDTDFKFHVSQTLFSSQDVDFGTKQLLKSFNEIKIDSFEKILDLGCGYGPIGIILKKLYPVSDVHMIDRDALALEYSRQNAVLNNLADIKIYGSLGYDDVLDTDFDLITSNIPAKVGERVLTHILLDAKNFLRPRGRVVVVVIDAIGDYVTKVLSAPGIKILYHKRWPSHLVFHYEFSSDKHEVLKTKLNNLKSGTYDRDTKVFSFDGHDISIKTTYNLSEFDTLDYETNLLLNNLYILKDKHINRAVIYNPGQGYVPCAVSKYTKIEQIDLISRDLQALRISKINLILNGYPESHIFLFHQVGVLQTEAVPADIVISILVDKDGPIVHAAIIQDVVLQLSDQGTVILASSSTAIARIEKLIRSKKLFRVKKRQRLKGNSVLIVVHK